MWLVQSGILFLILLVLPVLVGGIFAKADEDSGKLAFRWVSGQLCLWAGFLAVCVPIVLRPRPNSFHNVIGMYGVFVAAMLLFALATSLKKRIKGDCMKRTAMSKVNRDGVELLLWVIVLAVLAMQLVLAVVFAYEEGDDAFYVAISSITAESGTMYEILPYTGGTTGLDARHGLAPFPIWIAMLSKVSGVHAATMAQVVLPPVLIVMTYAIYFMIGRHLFCGKRRMLPMFMLLLELLVIFGGQSLYTAENFLLVRTAQGKAVLADVIIPFIILMLLVMFEKMQKAEGLPVRYWLLVAVTMVAGCLCSTQGALLVCMLLGVGGCCGAICYRRWRVILPMGICCVVPTVIAFLYLLLD